MAYTGITKTKRDPRSGWRRPAELPAVPPEAVAELLAVAERWRNPPAPKPEPAPEPEPAPAPKPRKRSTAKEKPKND